MSSSTNASAVPTVEAIATILEIDVDSLVESRTAIERIIAIDRETDAYAPIRLLVAELTATAGNVESIAAIGNLRAKSNEITAEIEHILAGDCVPPPVESDDWRRRLEQLQRNTQNIALANALDSFLEHGEYLAKIVTFLVTMPRAREATLELLLDKDYVAMATRLWKKTQLFCVYVHRLLSSATPLKTATALVTMLQQLEKQLIDVYEELEQCWQYATDDHAAMSSSASRDQQRRSIRSSAKLAQFTSLKRQQQQTQTRVKKTNPASRSESPTRMPGAFVGDDDDETSFALPDISMDEFERADISSSCVDGSIFNIHFAVNCLMSLVSFLFTISQKSHWHIDWQSRVNGVLGDLSQDYSSATALQRIGIAATGVALVGVTARIKNWPRVLATLATLGVGSLLLGTQTIVWLLFGGKDANNIAQPPLWFEAYTYTLNVLANNLHWISYAALRENDFLALIGATSLSTVSWIVDARTARTEQTLLLYTKKKITAGFAALAQYQSRQARQQQQILLPPSRPPVPPLSALQLFIEAPTTTTTTTTITPQQAPTVYTKARRDEEMAAALREVQQQEEAARRERESLRRTRLAREPQPRQTSPPSRQSTRIQRIKEK